MLSVLFFATNSLFAQYDQISKGIIGMERFGQILV